MAKFNLKREWYSKHFLDFMKSKNRYQILFGGRGSGKTHHIILKLIAISFLTDYNHIVYVNKIFGDIRKNQFKDIIKVLRATNLLQYFTINKTNYGFKNNLTGTEFTALGMDNAENTKGLSDPTIIWWDEINKGTQDDFTTLNALLRTPLNPNYQFIISFNPVSETSWLCTYFFTETNAYKVKEDFKDVYLNHSTYTDNDFIDKEKYLESLTLNSIGNQNKMLVDIKGLWGILDIKNPFFYALRRNIHFTDERYSLPSNTQLYLSFDFNKIPSTLVIGCVSQKEIAVIDLILCDENTMQGKSPLEAVCNKFKEKYLDSGLITRPYLIVTGDASGTAGGADKVQNENFYTKIESILGIGKSQRKIRKKNIEHKLSQEICNSLIYNCNFMIYKSAELALLDMEQAQIENGKLVKDNKDNGLHITDAVRYYIDCVLNFDKWQDYLRYYNKI
jgi:hypothetical protein